MIDRREFLISATSVTGLAAVGAPLLTTVAAAKTVNRVAVIGAGIVGASIAYNLSKRGCEVLVIEQRAPAAQASGNTFGWVNAAYANTPASYQLLRQRSLLEYHRLAADVDIPLRWSGSLEWFLSKDKEKRLIQDVKNFQSATGSPTWIIDADRAREVEPNLDLGGDWKLAYSTNDGAVDAAAATRALLARATEFGARIVMPATVIGLDERPDGIRIDTNVDTFVFDLAIVAAGVGTTDIAAMIGQGVDASRRSTPGVIVTTEPMAPILNTVLYPPYVHVHQQNDGRVILGEKAGPPNTDQHRKFLDRRPNVYPEYGLALQHADRVLEAAGKYVPGLSAAKVERVGIGWRPMPTDGLPLIGYAKGTDRVYFAAMHSGVSLAPIVGHLAAMEVLDRVRVDLLRDFRPERF
jgi:glycine/D-amino acid oxidase-like deaminating enzyme